MPLRLRYAYPQLYKSYHDYLLAFVSKGGIVEAKRNKAKVLQASFFIGPEGLV